MKQKILFSIENNDEIHNLYVNENIYENYQTLNPLLQKMIQDKMTLEFLKQHANLHG
jgi:hypothetical protein